VPPAVGAGKHRTTQAQRQTVMATQAAAKTRTAVNIYVATSTAVDGILIIADNTLAAMSSLDEAFSAWAMATASSLMRVGQL
jgi:hypothetical protein